MFFSFFKNAGDKFYSVKNFRIKFLTACFLLNAGGAYAQDLLPSGMKNLMEQIIEIITGDFAKGILIVSLAGCAIAYGFNKDNEKIKRNCIAIGVACAILACAGFIVEKVTQAAQTS
jgi:type IV secretory pathway VirB2 component (pilin)